VLTGICLLFVGWDDVSSVALGMSQGLCTRAMSESLLLVLSLNRCWFEPLEGGGGGVVLPIVSIPSHQTWFAETLVAELEDREIDWMLRKCSQVKRKAV
jgi:hypothetical protein